MYLMLNLFQLLSSQDVNWWTGVVWITCGLLWCFYQLFGLSFWRHPFTAEHPLLRHWCNDTFLQTWWRNKLIYILDGLSELLHFWVNYCFNPGLIVVKSIRLVWNWYFIRCFITLLWKLCVKVLKTGCVQLM